MRFPLSDYYQIERDKRKHILFIDDIFDGRKNAALTPVRKMLDTEYFCMSEYKQRRPDDMVSSINILCKYSIMKPDLIVAYGSGATLVAQITDIEKILIKVFFFIFFNNDINTPYPKPYYCTSNVLSNILGSNNQKKRIQLPGYGQPEYLNIERKIIWDWKQLEVQAHQYGLNKEAHTLFFDQDIETKTYKEHIEQFGDAVIVPGENIYTPEGINSIATFIKGILETNG